MSERVFTQSFVVVGALIERDDRFLLVKEAGKGADEGKWNQPAGWLDLGENPQDAAIREVKEETGYDFTPTQLLGVYSLFRKDLESFGKTPHAVKLIYIGKIAGDQAELHGDVSDTRWFTAEEIELMDSATLRDVDIKQLVRDYMANKAYPLAVVSHTVSR